MKTIIFSHNYGAKKCFAMAEIASTDQIKLNQIRVGRVFTVDDQIKERLVNNAII